ncbi:hypothetical protein ACFY9A_33700 [Streptomyces rubradiris]|uniref:hypothetical protein n=1 Tax=Streptomyces rubradiris TaxID=285531 RepID=UPI0036EE9437
MITRTSLLRLPPSELLPFSPAAPWDGARSTLSPPGSAEPLPDPQDADYDGYFDVARISRAPATAFARALPATSAEVTDWRGLPPVPVIARPAGRLRALE